METDFLGPCPSWTRPDCDSGAVYAVTSLPTEWGTGKVVYGPPAPFTIGSRVFTPTTVVECGNGHRVAGGHKVRSFQQLGN